MSVLQWARHFGSLVDLMMEILKCEALPGSGIMLFDVFVWFSVASLLVYFISKAFD